VFLAIGLGLLWSFRRRESCFDRVAGQFSQGGKVYNLRDLHAIQLIRDNVGGHQSSYNSYELNLVCHDAQRLNVTDHGALWPLRETALKLDCC